MLRVTIELVPHGNEDEKETISEIQIYNTGRMVGVEYLYCYEGWWKDLLGEIRKIKLNSILFDRRRKLWSLIYKVTKEISSNILEEEQL